MHSFSFSTSYKKRSDTNKKTKKLKCTHTISSEKVKWMQCKAYLRLVQVKCTVFEFSEEIVFCSVHFHYCV